MPEASGDTLSVIIASKNRHRDVQRCLESIRRQSLYPNQIVVVDQSTPPYELSDMPGLLHIRDTALRGLTAARNVGVSRSTCRLVLFLDDDTELAPDCLAALVACANQNLRAIGFGCAITNAGPSGRLTRLWTRIFERGFFDSGEIRRSDGVELRRVPGCAMAFRAKLFEKELFDENLSGYCYGEDWEFSKRARRYGTLRLVEQARVIHYVSQLNRYSSEKILKARWSNWHYFFRKLDGGKHLSDRIWRIWWLIGECGNWIRAGKVAALVRFLTQKRKEYA